MNTTTARVLPADVFDALELSVLASGGRVTGGPGQLTCGGPGCLLAHAAFLDGYLVPSPYNHDGMEYDDNGWDLAPTADAPVLTAVYDAFGALRPSDVYNPNDNVCAGKRLTWRAYTRKLGIVRGDA